ncbi:MAG: cyanophycinase [Alphaproteobacteria bacterium]|nr:cyanophycinase [Alphaproteobacteria bacterium]
MKYLITLCLAFCFSAPTIATAGKLMIVGGALSPKNEAIYQAFLGHVPAGKKIAIIAAASGSPVRSARLMAEDFVRYGFDADRIIPIRLALMDYKDTTEDESTWAANATSAEEINKLEDVGAVWFTGGDQARITATLLTADGADTPMALRIREILADGGILGGTSAGAAIMSRPMIADGQNLPALLSGMAPDVEGALRMQVGMGFLPIGLVDQHFDQRRRLGRLARAITYLPQAERLGFGIDENTGFLVDFGVSSVEVIGAGAFTILDGRKAKVTESSGGLQADGMVVHVLTDGDRLLLENGKPVIAPYKKRTVGNEYYKTAPVAGGGVAVPYPGIADFLGNALVDNSAARKVSAISFGDDGRGVRYVFRQWPESNGFWGRGVDGKAHYSIVGIRFSIEPVKITIQNLQS